MIHTWQELFKQEQKKDYFHSLMKELELEYQNKTIFPPKDKLFAALKATPLEKTKVVILGQDPYHNDGQAQGFAFSVPKKFPLPPSLKNIYKELETEFHQPVHRDGNLEDWARQGVLLLNTVLSVEAHKPLSHRKLGWQTFTTEILQVLNQKEGPLVFLLWGNNAIQAKKILTNPDHLVLTSAHPSPLSASRGFFGNGHFLKANQYLQEHHQDPIQWI